MDEPRLSQSELADLLGLHESTISRAIRRLGIEPEYGAILGSSFKAARLTPEQVRRIGDHFGRRPDRRTA